MSAHGEPASPSAARIGDPPWGREVVVEVGRDGAWSCAFAIGPDEGASVPPPILALVRTLASRVLDAGGYEVLEQDLELAGERHALVCRAAAVSPERVVCIVTDVTAEREALEALRTSEAGYRTLVELAPDALIVLDDEERIVFVNAAASSSLGYEEGALLGLHLLAITPAEPGVEQFLRWKAQGAPGTALIETKHLRRDGSTFDVEVHVLRAQFRGAIHTFGFVRDATQRKRAEQALRRSEATMRSLVEHAPAIIAVTDLEGRARFVSGDLAGWSRGRLVGKRLSAMLAAGDAEELERVLARIRSTGRSEDMEVCMPDPQGVGVWLNVRIARVDADPDAPTLVHIVQDVTEARRTREALRASEARFRQLVEQAVDGIYVFDAEGRIVDVNASVCESLGLDRTELVGKPITAPSLGMVLADVLDRCRRLPPRGSITFETIHAGRGGRVFPVEMRVGRLEAGGPPRFVALARDISDRRDLDRAALEAVEREQRRFGRDLHDGLGQELAGIAFLAKALESTLRTQERPEAPQAGEIARRVAGAIAQARAMAHGLAPVGVHGDELVTALEALAADTATVFGVRCHTDAAEVRGLDAATATALYRIAQEAVTNALRHAKAREIAIGVECSAGDLTLQVRDDGVGIGRPASAAGLGLQLMALRARRLGGRLEVHPGAAGGTEVVCVIPVPTLQKSRAIGVDDAPDPV
jgi:PAS domain S-box-containing protein